MCPVQGNLREVILNLINTFKDYNAIWLRFASGITDCVSLLTMQKRHGRDSALDTFNNIAFTIR